jgi:hypothetical protein
MCHFLENYGIARNRSKKEAGSLFTRGTVEGLKIVPLWNSGSVFSMGSLDP